MHLSRLSTVHITLLCESITAFGGPVVAPSANLSGHVSPTNAAHVESDLAGLIEIGRAHV